MGTLEVLQNTAHSGQHRLTAHQMVRDTLRLAILSGRLPGGTRLVQADIATTLNVSTTPVREALRELASDGLIQFDPHRGAVVHELDMEELKEIYVIRMVLEPLAVRLAAERLTKEQLARAAELLREMDDTDDPGWWVERNWQFHSLIEQAAGSRRLAAVIKTVQNSATLYVAHSVQLNPARMREGNAEHKALLSALNKRDGDKAAEILEKHLNRTMQGILKSADASDQPVPGGRAR
ncbi:MAG: GntR family transcriptional regulator [Pseudonocardiales bacterium]|nr:MAG: GntR family transcriptional regulator [Pseudonocardiales bacterium]